MTLTRSIMEKTRGFGGKLFGKWRINAPEDFPWTAEDVMFEKTQSFLNGIVVGAISMALVFSFLMIVLA